MEHALLESISQLGRDHRLINAVLGVAVELLEAPRYTYDEVEEKRWILGSGGRSGNCEFCIEAEEKGWILDGDIFEGPMGDADGPPLHPHCSCELEYRTRRTRVNG